MNKRSFKKFQLLATLTVMLFVGSVLLWMHYHGGVPIHHILQRKNLPAISNWWGGILLPLFCWYSCYKIEQRINKHFFDKQNLNRAIKNSLLGFVGALIFGTTLAVSFNYGYSNFLNYQVDSLLLLFFLVPIFRSEYLLGFILGMTITFGAILPTAFALVVAIPSVIIYVFIRPYLLKLIYLIFKRDLKKL